MHITHQYEYDLIPSWNRTRALRARRVSKNGLSIWNRFAARRCSRDLTPLIHPNHQRSAHRQRQPRRRLRWRLHFVCTAYICIVCVHNVHKTHVQRRAVQRRIPFEHTHTHNHNLCVCVFVRSAPLVLGETWSLGLLCHRRFASDPFSVTRYCN